MANIVVTSTAFTVLVVFNDYSDHEKIKQGSYRRDEIAEVIEHTGDEHITLVMLNGDEFKLSFSAAAGVGVIDTVDGVAPVSNDDLFAKLVALQQV